MGDPASESNQPPWPEWDDAFINTMQWTNKPTKLTLHTPKDHNKIKQNATPNNEENEDLFEDPSGLVNLPESLKVKSWIRPHHYDPNGNIVLKPDSELDLGTCNGHLMNCQIMRLIVESVMCLLREAISRPFPVEFQSSQFVATGNWEWKPWHHVYALSKAGKGITHTLTYNSYGKYVVRLFYMGKWRRLLVDDRLPLSPEGLLLLPISHPNNLWLPILSKALLRAASLSWTVNNHAVDFSIVHCLTGWIPTNVPCRSVSQNHLWCVCCQLMDSTGEVVRSPGCCARDIDCPDDITSTDLPAVGSRMILGCVKFPLQHPLDEPNSVSSLDHLFLLKSAKFDNNLSSSLWKEYRWNNWAYNKNIISEIPLKTKRNVLIYDPLKVSYSSTTRSDDAANEDELWVDFDVFILLTRYLEVYYKPSYFKYRLRAWTLPELLSIPDSAVDVVQEPLKGKMDEQKSPKTSRNKSPKPDKANKTISSIAKQITKGKKKEKNERSSKEKHIYIEDSPVNVYNPPLFYLVTDSMVCKQLYFCLSAYDQDKPTYAHIFTGKFEWFSPSVAPKVFMLTTSATNGYVLELCPGLHVFRIWHHFPQHFCLQVYSNTQFYNVKINSLHHILSSESVSLRFYGKEISAKFEALLSAPKGGVEHGQMYSQLINSLKPQQLERHLDFAQLLSAQVALEQFGEKTVMHLRKGLYEFVQGCKISKRENELKAKQLQDVIEENIKNKKNKAQKRQSPKAKKDKVEDGLSPKSPTMSLKSRKQKVDSKTKPDGGSVQLRKLLLCKENNLLLNDPVHVITLLRKMMKKVSHLRKFYLFGSEDDCQLMFQDYLGEVHVDGDWVVLVRCVLNIHSSEPVPCSLHLWSPAEKVVLRLINNDTLTDIPLGFVENRVAKLSRNNGGYSAIAYCKVSQDNQPWRLRSIGVRESDILHVCNGSDCRGGQAKLPKQHQQTVRGFYIPNRDKLIARCILEVYSDVTVLLRLELSNASACCNFTILDGKGNYVVNITGINHIIIPILPLKGPENSNWLQQRNSDDSYEAALYKVEVQVVGDSWPLSKDECKAMLLFKENLPEMLWSIDTKGNIKDNSLRESLKLVNQYFPDESEIASFINTSKPTWGLTLVTDFQKMLPVQLRLDISFWEKLQQLQDQWLGTSQDMMDKGHKLRQEFLEKYKAGEEGWSEDTLFHLVPRKTEELINVYSQQCIEPCHSWDTLQKEEWSVSSLCSKCYTLITRKSTKWSLTSLCEECYESCTRQSVGIKDSQSIQTRIVKNNRNILIQQAAIHEALEQMKKNTKEHFEQIFEEINQKRIEVCTGLQAMKQNALHNAKTKNDSTLISSRSNRTKNTKSPTRKK